MKIYRDSDCPPNMAYVIFPNHIIRGTRMHWYPSRWQRFLRFLVGRP